METRPKKKSSLLFRLSLLIGLPLCLIVLVFLILAVLSSNDQIRPLTVSDNPFEPILKREVLTRIKESARQPDKKVAKAALLEIAQISFPWPNIASWPAGQQEEARRYKAEMSELLVDYLTLIERTRGMAQEDAFNQLENLGVRWRSIAVKYKGCLGHCSKAERAALSNQFQTFFHATYTGLYVDRGLWLNAAAVNLANWDQATYYLRRGGIKGRSLLTLWSVLRRIYPERFK